MARLKKAATLTTPRHSFATHLLEANTEVRVIQVPLGHAKLTNHCALCHVATITSPMTLARFRCPKGVLRSYVPNGRHCPKCQGPAVPDWMAARADELLPVECFHLVFTLPAEVAQVACLIER